MYCTPLVFTPFCWCQSYRCSPCWWPFRCSGLRKWSTGRFLLPMDTLLIDYRCLEICKLAWHFAKLEVLISCHYAKSTSLFRKKKFWRFGRLHFVYQSSRQPLHMTPVQPSKKYPQMRVHTVSLWLYNLYTLMLDDTWKTGSQNLYCTTQTQHLRQTCDYNQGWFLSNLPSVLSVKIWDIILFMVLSITFSSKQSIGVELPIDLGGFSE